MTPLAMPPDEDFANCGPAMHELARELFPICRSITGDGVRTTLRILQEHAPLAMHEVPSGTRVFDWTVPREWNIKDAYILDGQDDRIVDFRDSNLHVVGYSVPIDATVPIAELQEHLHSLEELPDAIPYVTSYYEERWGFCMRHDHREALSEPEYRVVIDSELKDGHLTYGELIIPGESSDEVLLSTYVCHPSLANNELSGPVVTTWLAKWLATEPRRLTYRIVFLPETIGSLTYLSKHLAEMKQRTVAGFNITCVGDDRAYSYLPSRGGETLADRVAVSILTSAHPEFVSYSFLDRGSDERQYCSPGADLPVVSVMRSKYHEYPEYHTSKDDLELVTPTGLQGGFDVLRDCLELLERNKTYRTSCVGEPQLGRRGLYPTLGTRDSSLRAQDVMNVLAYADGTNDLIALSDLTGIPVKGLYAVVNSLAGHGLLVEI